MVTSGWLMVYKIVRSAVASQICDHRHDNWRTNEFRQDLVYNEHLPRGVMVVDTLTCKKNGLYPVHVANLGQADVWLNKGVRVGMIKEVDVICDSDSDTCI